MQWRRSPHVDRFRLGAVTAAGVGMVLVAAMGPAPAALAASADVVISQVYGGGGNSGATWKQDFVQLTNRGGTTVDLTGWAVQYASAAGTTWQVTPLSGTLGAGEVLLVQEAAGSGGTTDLPSPDVTGSIAMSATSGKVALTTVATALTCGAACSSATAVRDFVGYGTAGDHEGAAAAPTLSNTTAAHRAAGADTDDNAADFTAAAPDPGADGDDDGTTPAVGIDCAASDVPVGQVQGDTETSPAAGTTVTVQGTVVGDFEGPSPALRGFYLQDAGDDDDTTSDGVFVFDNLGGVSPDLVQAGQEVQVTGTVQEYQGQTQVTAAAIDLCAEAADAPEPAAVKLPVASATALERYEGMLVTLPQKLRVTDTYLLGRFGEVTVSSGQRLRQPSDAYRAGSAEATALEAANALNQLVLDDGTNAQNPTTVALARDGQALSATNTLRGGDTVRDAVGVLTYTWGGTSASPNTYRVRVQGALGGTALFVGANERPTTTPEVGGTVQVASANLLNFFNTYGTACTGGVTGAAMECRGASDDTEYQRQLAKEVAALRLLDADVVGLLEVENDGYGTSSALQALVDALNAVDGAGTWAFVDADAGTGTTDVAGSDAIKAALLYRADVVTPVPGTTLVDSAEGVFERNPVAQTFATGDGARVSVVVNHFKSKGSCPTSGENADQGDGQSCWNPHRVAQAEELARWVDATVVPTGGTDDVVLVGDFNAYTGEDPVAVLEEAGYVDLARAHEGTDAYSYSYDGLWGSLDHAFASASLAGAVTDAATVHVASDEPTVLDYTTDYKSTGQLTTFYSPDAYRYSDHDPLLVGLDLGVAAAVTGGTATAVVGERYRQALTVTGTGTVRLTVTDGRLPDGLKLTSAGVLSGKPDTAGTWTFTVTATNGYGSSSTRFTVVVEAG